jgi:hypothetical protein
MRNRQRRWNSVEVQNLADEIAQRHHELGGVHGAPGNHLGGCSRRQPHLLFGSEEQNVG